MEHGSWRAIRVLGPIVGGLALWTMAGAQAFADQSASTDRLGVLPHAAWAIPAVLVLAWLAWRPARRLSDAHVLLLAASLALLPWLPLRIPALFIWTPMVLAILLVVVSMTPAGRSLLTAGLSERWRLPDERWSPWIASALAVALYACGPVQLQARLPGGDEPHYLVIAQSLVKDGDLRIENNHRAQDYAAYYEGELKPHYLNRGTNGEIYSVHAPGLPAIIAPAFAVGGYAGAVALVVLISALGTALVWKLAFALTGSREAAWFGWAASALSVPYAFLAFTIYPDIVAAVLVLVGFAVLVWGPAFRGAQWFGAGAALAVLPWLHSRYAILAAALAVVVTLREFPRPGGTRHLMLFFAAPVVSAAGWFAFFYAIYGTPSPSAPYGGFHNAGTSLHNVWRGLPGLLFDQQFGLLAVAPVFVASLLAWLLSWRQQDMWVAGSSTTLSPRRLALELGAVVVPYIIVSASYEMWWGGHSPPARFLVPVLPVFGVMAACSWAWARTRASRLFALVALGATIFITAAFMAVSRGDLVYNARDGRAVWLEWLNPLVDLTTALPSLHRDGSAIAMEHVVVWVACLGLAWALTAFLERRGKSESILTLSAVLAAAMATMTAATWVWARTGATALTAPPSQAWLMSRYGEGRLPTAIRYAGHTAVIARPRLVRPQEALASLHITSDPRRGSQLRSLFFVRNLPAGRYQVHPSPSVGSAGLLHAWTGRAGSPFFSVDLSTDSSHGPPEFEVPVTVPSLTITAADDVARASVSQVWLTPLAVGSSLATPEPRRATRAVRYGDTTVFFLNVLVFPERTGFWIAPGISTPLVLQPSRGGTPLRMWLRNGPVRNTLSLSMGPWHDTLALAPGEERLMELPAGRDGKPVRLEARAAFGFRPHDVDPASTDVRRLAVWMEPR